MIKLPLEQDRYDYLKDYIEHGYVDLKKYKLTNHWKHFGRERIKLINNSVYLDTSLIDMNENFNLNSNSKVRLGHDDEYLANFYPSTHLSVHNSNLIKKVENIWKGIKCIDLLNLKVKTRASIKACHMYNYISKYTFLNNVDAFLNDTDAFLNNINTLNVLEIGPGSGWLAKVITDQLLRNKFKVRYVMVDLPGNIAFSYINLCNWFPSAKIILPHDYLDSSKYSDGFDFMFIRPDQLLLLKNDIFDLAIQVDGFQEMLPEVIKYYFSQMRRLVRPNNYFLCCNRIAKDMFDGERSISIKYNEYPWLKSDKIIFNVNDKFFGDTHITRICSLSKL